MKDVVKLILLILIVSSSAFLIYDAGRKEAYVEDYSNCIRFFGSKLTLNDSMGKCSAILGGEMDITDMVERNAD